jgi:dipeptidyl aminopeptidase/acylaminoacyl peptidase
MVVSTSSNWLRLGAGLLLAAIAGTIEGASGPAPYLSLPPQVHPDDTSQWWFQIRVVNPLSNGLYTDSMSCDIEDLDPGETRMGRLHRLSLGGVTLVVSTDSARDKRPSLGGVTQVVPTVSPRDSGSVTFAAMAGVEHARLTFRLYAHDAKGKRYVVTGATESFPSDAAANLPSKFLDSGGRRIEYLLVPPIRRPPSSPAILLVHGHGSHARQLIARALVLSERNYWVMVVSQPGYGLSQGPADLMGPATVQALERALDILERTPGVDSTRIAAWGVSRGATAVTLLAERRPELRALVAQSGIYDLWATYRGTRVTGFPETIVREAGKDSAAWRERSPIMGADRIRSAVLVLHGEKDENVPVDQAHEFAAALKQRGARAETRFFWDEAHALPTAEVDKTAFDFLTRELGPATAEESH